MCAIDAYYKHHPPKGPDNDRSGGGRNLPSISSAQCIAYLGHTFHFIDQLLQFFDFDCSTRFSMYNNKIQVTKL